MRKVLVFLLMLVLPPVALAQSPDDLNMAEIEDRISSIVHYAEEYEIGNINYLQLNVHGFQIRSDLNLMLGGGIGENWARIPRENIEKIFGKPADYIYWIWVDNKHMEKRLDEAMPRWERIIFDGRKVQIIFNAFPSAIEMENGEMFKYYSVDLNVRFKKKFDFDFKGMLDDITSLTLDYNATRTRKAGETLVRKMLEAQGIWGSYVQENIERCTDVMDILFTPDEKWPKEKAMRWRFSLYKGSDFDVMADIDMCQECEWHFLNMMFRVEGRGPMFIFRSPELQWGKLEHQVDEEYYWTLTADMLNKEIEKAVSEVREEAEKYDKTRSEDFPKKFFFNRFKISQINRILDGKYNGVENFDTGIAKRIESGELQGPGSCKNLDECRQYCGARENIGECRNFTYNLRVGAADKMFTGYDIEKTLSDRIWWERRPVENFALRQDSWCRYMNDVQCKEDEGCVDGKCVLALKGKEVCDNKEDDDLDGMLDCQDPDCSKESACKAETYICKGRTYTKPCDEANMTCGKNQILAENECVCREGFRDCDNDGNCEPTKACGLEICDDNKDNNNDGLVDCLDQKCNRQVCGSTEGKELLCIAKSCILPEEEIPPKELEPVCGNHVCEKNENETCVKDCVVCEAHEPPECPDGKIVWKGKDSLGCNLPPVCVVIEKACETDNDCAQPKCGVSRCVADRCKVTELTTDCEEGCQEGRTKKRACRDGSEITTAVCSANEWIKTGYDCPESQIILPVILPEENITEGIIKENVTKEIMPEENITEVPIILPVIRPEKNITENITEEAIAPVQPEENVSIITQPKEEKVSEEEISAPSVAVIAHEVEKKAPGASGACVLADNCGGPQDVCSNGNCVTLPIPVEEKKEKEEKAEETPRTEAPGKSEAPKAEEGAPGQEKKAETTEQPQASQSQEGTPTGSATARFSDFLTGLITGENSCTDECRPCEECNQEVDALTKRIEAGEISGPGNCKNRATCEAYCQNEEHKEECENFSRNYGIKTVNCWWEFCRECDRCRFSAGELKCSANQQFSMEEGFCKCTDGWNDCDGDWENGCESEKRCDACQSKDDCAADRCAPWGNVVQQFDCFKGESWVEERGAVRVLGDCRFYPARMTEGSLGFDMYGEPFEALQPIREEVEIEMGEPWCKWELDNLLKERLEIQNSFTASSLKWFFEEYIPSSPSEWEKHIGGIYDSYWRIVNNNERTAQMLLCTGNNKWPEDYKPIDVSYDTSFGSVRIWEVETTTDFYGKRTKILSPYMQIWVFPPKEFIKKEFQEAMETGMMPGPEGKKNPELSPSEIEEAKKDKKLMDFVNSISAKYGGEAKFLLNIVDKNELVFNALITISPEIIFRMEPMKAYGGDYNAKLTIDFDFFYDLIQAGERDIRGGQTEYPPWEKEGLKISDMIKGVVDGVRMWLMINSASLSGKITAEPSNTMSDGLDVLRMMFERGPS